MAVLLAAAALPLPAIAQAPEYQEQQQVAPAPAAEADPWPFDESDLPVDPRYRVGVLDNGMRYVIRPNATPAGTGMVRLWIDDGSVAEREGELGWAHFIEHMAFNGSTNVPEGEMIRLLEREGLAFGPDTNASTGFDSVTYMLDLPRNDEDLLDTALMLMRETASELTFEPEAVEREKGVILSERRVRDTYALQNLVDNLEFEYPGSRFAERLPIGTVETIEDATSEGLRDLYERTYRPDNAAVIVVGDFDPDLVESKIREYFAGWDNPGGEASEVDFGPVDLGLAGETDIFLDPALSSTVSAVRLGPVRDEVDTVASRRQRVLRQIGYGIVNRRLQRLQREAEPPFRAAGFGTSDTFEVARSTTLTVQAIEDDWRRGLLAAQEEYRRAMMYGFSEAEVAEQVANLRSAIESNAAGAETRRNSDFVTGALTLLRDDQVPTTPQSALERFTAHEPEITPETVLAALREDVVPLENPLLRFSGPDAPDGGAEALRETWEQGMATEIAPREEAELVEFAYQDFGEPGTIVSDEVEPLLGIRQITFANGLKLNLKQTDLEDDNVQVQLNVDGGDLLNTREDPLATAMTDYLFVGGLGEHTLDELQSMLAGRRVGISIGSADETFRLSAQSTPGDLELQLQLFAATLLDAAYRPAGEAQYYQSVRNFFASREATPESTLGTSEEGILSGGDPRFSLLDEEDYLALTFDRLRENVDGRFKEGALELALVGDFDEERAVDLVARTLGALPAREPEFRDYIDNRNRPFTQDRGTRTLYHEGAADQALLRMVWPTRDDDNFEDSMTLELLERVMRIELTDSLREELGQTYSPGVGASQSRVYPGYGTFGISASIDTSDVDATRAAMLETVEALRDAPVDEDVLLRARQPMLESYENALKTNAGWMSLVDRAQTDPERIQRFDRVDAMLLSLTPAQLQEAARRYLDPAERVEIVVLPEPEDAAE